MLRCALLPGGLIRCPECHSRDMRAGAALRLASGDADGRVVVWDVAMGTSVATLKPQIEHQNPKCTQSTGSCLQCTHDPTVND